MTKKDIEILDDMLTALVDLLVEKGVITQEEYDSKVKQRLEETKGLTRFEDLED
jgi:DNA-binding HxlR family transcriptional regulator